MRSWPRTSRFAAALAAAVVTLADAAAMAEQAQPPAPAGDDACANAAEEAQGLRREGKLTRARERLLVCSGATCPAFIQKDCAGWMSEVDRVLPSVVFRAVDAGGKDMSNVRVVVDGQPLVDKLDGRAVAVDPGEHVFRFEAPGAPAVSETLIVREGEANRLVSVTLGSGAAAKPHDGAGEDTFGKGIPGASWALGIGGAVLGAIGTVLWLTGTSDHGEMEVGCARTRTCVQSDVDSARTKLVVGDVAMGLGIVMIGAAVYLALTAPKPATSAHVDRFGTFRF